LLATALTSAACAKDPASTPPAKTEPAASPATAGAIDENLPPGDGPVAKVGGVDVPLAPFLKEYRQTLGRYAKAKHEVRPGLRERLKNTIVQRLVDAEIIKQQATKLGVLLAPEETKKGWEEYRARYGDETRFKEFLEKAGSSAEDMEQLYINGQLREKLFEKVSANVKVTPEAARAFYEENKAKYSEPEQIKASHILFQIKEGMTPEEKAAKKAEAIAVQRKVKAPGADFAALAKKHSGDATAERGGDLGWFPRDRMVKPFEEAAFALKDNQVSGVVESPFGFHIIKRTGHRDAGTQKFEDMQERIMHQLTARDRQAAIRDALDRWRKDSNVEIFVKGDEAMIAADKGSAPLGAIQQQKLDANPHGVKVDPMPRPVTNDAPVVGH